MFFLVKGYIQHIVFFLLDILFVQKIAARKICLVFFVVGFGWYPKNFDLLKAGGKKIKHTSIFQRVLFEP